MTSEEVDPGRLHDVMLDVAKALAERFPDRDPTEAEVRAFLREHLQRSGRDAAEIEAILADLDRSPDR